MTLGRGLTGRRWWRSVNPRLLLAPAFLLALSLIAAPGQDTATVTPLPRGTRAQSLERWAAGVERASASGGRERAPASESVRAPISVLLGVPVRGIAPDRSGEDRVASLVSRGMWEDPALNDPTRIPLVIVQGVREEVSAGGPPLWIHRLANADPPEYLLGHRDGTFLLRLFSAAGEVIDMEVQRIDRE